MPKQLIKTCGLNKASDIQDGLFAFTVKVKNTETKD